MIEHYYLGVYWGARKQSILDCSRRAVHFFNTIRLIDPVFLKWYRTTASSNRSERSITVSESSMLQLLQQGIYRTDTDKSQIAELGYSFAAWNSGEGGGWVNVRFNCGGYSPWVSNCCVVELPHEGESVNRLLQVDILTELMKAGVRSWTPDHGVIISDEFRNLTQLNDDKPVIGWLTYFSKQYIQLPVLPSTVQKIDLGDLGNIVVITQDLCLSSCETHVSAARKLATLI